MKEINRKEKGITLVALVVTIIVLLILAGIAISLSIGNNGLFSRAGNAANIWRKAEANEQEEMRNFEDLYDNTLRELEENQPKEEVLANKARPGDYVAYIPPQNNKFTMEIEDTGHKEPQSYNTEDYKGLWQVLYNNEEYGLQIVSADDVTNEIGLKLGYVGNNEACKIAYNKSVETLNKFCENYTNEEYAIKEKGRCVGSDPDNPAGDTKLFTNSEYKYVETYAKDLIDGDTNYKKDYDAMKEAKSQNENGIHDIGKAYWTASRYVDLRSFGAFFGVRRAWSRWRI